MKLLARTRHALAIPGQNFLYSRVICFLYRDRSRIEPGHPTRIYFHPLQFTSLVFMRVLLVVPVGTILESFFVICKQNVGVAHATQLKALSGWASPISHGKSIEPGQCGIQNYNGSMDIGVHGSDSHGAFGLRLPLPPKDCGSP
ncbi:hypothetical protein, partial [Caballeronia udeis]|uniref:hypothetical protein n=1 Tax=Caballeronia udeis TaxID=1232866 RepID=UPI001E5F6481